MIADRRHSFGLLLCAVCGCADAGGEGSGDPQTGSGTTGTGSSTDVLVPTSGEATSSGGSSTGDESSGETSSSSSETSGSSDGSSESSGSSSGEPVGAAWLRSFGAPDTQRPGGLGFTAGGELWVAGDVIGNFDLGLGALVGEGSGIYLARYAENGDTLHAQAMFAEDGQPTLTTVTGLAVDGTGAVVVTGWLEGNYEIGGEALVADEIDVFVGKWDAGGAPVWGRKFGEVDWQVGYAIAVGANDEIWVAGAALAPFTAGDLVLTGAASTGMFLIKMASDGTPEVGRWWGDMGDQEAWGVAVCDDGSVALAGFITAPLMFGGEQVAAKAGKDMFVAKVDGDGEPLWIRGLGGAGADIASHVRCADEVLFAGTVSGAANIGELELTPSGDADAVIGRFDEAGSLVWAAAATGTEDQVPAGIGFEGGDVLVALTSTGSTDLGGAAIEGAGNRDVLLARYEGAAASPTNVVRVGGAERESAGALALHSSGARALAMSHAGALEWDGLAPVDALGPEDLALLRWGPGGF